MVMTRGGDRRPSCAVRAHHRRDRPGILPESTVAAATASTNMENNVNLRGAGVDGASYTRFSIKIGSYKGWIEFFTFS